MNFLTSQSPQQILNQVLRVGLVVINIVHLLYGMVLWRMAANAHAEVTTRSGRILILVNILNVFLIIGALLLSVILLLA